MNFRYTLLFVCFVFIQGTTNACEELVEDFLIYRDTSLRLILCDATRNWVDALEDYLGFPLTSDEHWRNLLCDVADVGDLSDLETVLNEHIAAPVSMDTIGSLLTAMEEAADNLPEALLAVERYQHKVQPWLAKTNFPHIWPVQNTGKRETARVMAKGRDENVINLLTFAPSHHDDDDLDYNELAKALLEADSLEDYLSVVNEDLIADPAALECYTGTLDLYRDTEAFSVVPENTRAYFRVVDHLKDIGIFDLVP